MLLKQFFLTFRRKDGAINNNNSSTNDEKNYNGSECAKLYVPFLLGVLSASFLWCGVFLCFQHQLKKIQNEVRESALSSESSTSENEKQNEKDLSTIKLLENVKQSIRRISTKINEIPTYTRWPWDIMPRRFLDEDSRISENLKDIKNVIEEEIKLTHSENNGKTGLDIGSIFGLDVGGTLAKLVYFEHDSTKESRYSDLSKNSSLSSVTGKLTEEQFLFHREYSYRKSFQPDDVEDSSLEDKTSSMKNETQNRLKRSSSLIDVQKYHGFMEALNGFYSLVSKLDSISDYKGIKEKSLSIHSHKLGGKFHFLQFETRRMQAAIQLIRENHLHLNIVEMGATGGGAHKYAQEWQEQLGIKMNKYDELDCLVAGMQFLLRDVIGECYTFKPNRKEGESNAEVARHEDETWYKEVKRNLTCHDTSDDEDNDEYPYLLVTIGTGVSVLRVDGKGKHERISGSSIGGGTYWGLCRLLIDVLDFEHALNLAAKGDPFKVDMSVGDIYGTNSGALEKLGLPAYIVASSFGKLVAKNNPASGIRQEDLARAILVMVTNNVAQIAYLNAKLHKTSRIYFVGNFLRHNDISQRRLAYAIYFWSKGKMEALFLKHEGYFGALGAFLLNQEHSLSSSYHKLIHVSSETEHRCSSIFAKNSTESSENLRTSLRKSLSHEL